MEQRLYEAIKERRSKGNNFCSSFIKITAKRLLEELDHPLKDQFKSSNGWFVKFCERRRIKFRKEKSGKKVSAEKELDVIQDWLGKFHHKILPLREGQECPDFRTKWGRFPPKSTTTWNGSLCPLWFLRIPLSQQLMMMMSTSVFPVSSEEAPVHNAHFHQRRRGR
jgi:hypothetical protein